MTPPTKLDEMKDHAETFDLNFVQRKNQTIYCFSEALIYDYLVLKAITTKGLNVVIVTNGKLDQKLTKVTLLDRINETGLIDKIIKHTLSDRLKFKNGSIIQILNYDDTSKLHPGSHGIDLLHIRNTALSCVYYTLSISNFTGILHVNGRVIYNFDA